MRREVVRRRSSVLDRGAVSFWESQLLRLHVKGSMTPVTSEVSNEPDGMQTTKGSLKGVRPDQSRGEGWNGLTISEPL